MTLTSLIRTGPFYLFRSVSFTVSFTQSFIVETSTSLTFHTRFISPGVCRFSFLSPVRDDLTLHVRTTLTSPFYLVLSFFGVPTPQKIHPLIVLNKKSYYWDHRDIFWDYFRVTESCFFIKRDVMYNRHSDDVEVRNGRCKIIGPVYL